MKDDFDKVACINASEEIASFRNHSEASDLKKYYSYLDDLELSESEKDELLVPLAFYANYWVDLAFRKNPYQLACGKDDGRADEVFTCTSREVVSRNTDTDDPPEDSVP